MGCYPGIMGQYLVVKSKNSNYLVQFTGQGLKLMLRGQWKFVFGAMHASVPWKTCLTSETAFHDAVSQGLISSGASLRGFANLVERSLFWSDEPTSLTHATFEKANTNTGGCGRTGVILSMIGLK